jgi:hypothetical protein
LLAQKQWPSCAYVERRYGASRWFTPERFGTSGKSESALFRLTADQMKPGESVAPTQRCLYPELNGIAELTNKRNDGNASKNLRHSLWKGKTIPLEREAGLQIFCLPPGMYGMLKGVGISANKLWQIKLTGVPGPETVSGPDRKSPPYRHEPRVDLQLVCVRVVWFCATVVLEVWEGLLSARFGGGPALTSRGLYMRPRSDPRHW